LPDAKLYLIQLRRDRHASHSAVSS